MLVGCDDEDVLFVRDGFGAVDVAGGAGVVDEGAVCGRRRGRSPCRGERRRWRRSFRRGASRGDLAGERTGRVAEVELFTVEAK